VVMAVPGLAPRGETGSDPLSAERDGR
jgi:hypothetical protein